MKSVLISVLLLCPLIFLSGQHFPDTFTSRADSLSDSSFNYSKRKKIVLAAGISSYTAVGTGLYFAWYNQFDQSAFHSFDDWDEWVQMDKVGHIYSAYLQSDLIYGVSRWAGFDQDQALKLGAISSLAGQLGIEIMDGFSTQWGFSWTDMGSNVLGTSLFYFQQKHLGHQMFRMKFSYWPVSYSPSTFSSSGGQAFSSQEMRSQSLFGSSGLERFLKDYNGQTIWISSSLYHFFPRRNIPKWLAISFGYSGKNLYGGVSNEWEVDGQLFSVDNPRTRQFILALDYNLSELKSNRPLVKSLLRFANIIKWPAPGVSYSRADGFSFHVVFTN